MTASEIKAELNKVRAAERRYKLMCDKVDAFEQILIGGKGISYETDGSTHERDGNPIERAYCKLADYEQEKEAAAHEWTRQRLRAEEIISSVADDIQREVLTRRYIIGQTWEDIAQSMNYSVRNITRIHGRALPTAGAKLFHSS